MIERVTDSRAILASAATIVLVPLLLGVFIGAIFAATWKPAEVCTAPAGAAP